MQIVKIHTNTPEPFRWDDENYNVMHPLPAADPIRFENEWSGWTLRRKASKEDN